jgi:hypothetical protein
VAAIVIGLDARRVAVEGADAEVALGRGAADAVTAGAAMAGPLAVAAREGDGCTSAAGMPAGAVGALADTPLGTACGSLSRNASGASDTRELANSRIN